MAKKKELEVSEMQTVKESSGNKIFSMMLKDEKNLLASSSKPTELVMTESPSLNWALNGGFPKGQTTLLYGPEGSGKSLVSMMAVGSLQSSDPDAYAVVISTEMRAPSPQRLKQLGVDPDRTLIRQANTLHDVFDWINSKDEKFTNSDGSKGGPGLAFAIDQGVPFKALIIDSIKGIQGPKEQNLESVEKDFMGDLSKVLNPALRSILGMIRQHNLMTIFVQQVNMNMDQDEVKYQNKKYIIPSGQALKHFVEVSFLVERVVSKTSKLFDETLQSIRELPVQVGHTIRMKNDKHNLGKPFREAEFQIHYSKGIVNTGTEVATMAMNLNIITKPINPETGKTINAQYVFKGNRWVGADKMILEIEKSPELQREIMEAVEALDK